MGWVGCSRACICRAAYFRSYLLHVAGTDFHVVYLDCFGLTVVFGEPVCFRWLLPLKPRQLLSIHNFLDEFSAYHENMV